MAPQPSPDRPPPGSSFREAFEGTGDVWPASEVVGNAEPHLQRVVEALGGLDLHAVPSVAVRGSILAFAVVNRHDGVRAADPAFPFDGALPPALVRLVRQARRGSARVGLVETGAGELIAVCAALSDRTGAWPLQGEVGAAARTPGADVVIMAFTPLGDSPVARRALSVFGLSDLEARVAVALLEAPTLEIAASRVGVGRETARSALNGAMRKVGVKRTPELVRRISDVICGAPTGEGDILGQALDLTPAQAQVARLAADGASVADAAGKLGVTTETVKSHLRSVFRKSGIERAKDLGRADVELRSLEMLSRAREVVTWADESDGRHRIIARPDGRRVAFIDYGPTQGRPLLLCHALASGRTLPPGLASKLRAAGFRPITPQRPGFGLTDPHGEDYLTTAANDMAAILDALKADMADVFARDIATAALLAFATAHPERIGRVVLLNPEAPQHRHGRDYAITAAARLLTRHPEATVAFFEVLRRQMQTRRLAAMVVESFRNGAPSDGRVLQDPERLLWMVRDMQAMAALTAKGVISERLVYSTGWRPPTGIDASRWTIACCRELGDVRPGAWWETLPGARTEQIPEGGLLLPLSHPDTVVRLLAPSI